MIESPRMGRLPAEVISAMLLSNVSRTTAREGRIPFSAMPLPEVPTARTSLGSRCMTNVKPSAILPGYA